MINKLGFPGMWESGYHGIRVNIKANNDSKRRAKNLLGSFMRKIDLIPKL